jgi:Uncharacterised nucleotidyltransferase
MNTDAYTSGRGNSLVSALLEPAGTRGLDARQWNELLWQGHKYDLRARLYTALAAHGLDQQLPPKAQTHFRAASIAVESSQTAVRFEINRVMRALGDLDTPVILLKGAAYMMAGLPPARGRMIGDLDLMVPRSRIDAVEQTLVANGWVAPEISAYDQRYYRDSMHEIPPLQHPERDTPVDIHHTIAPPTARARIDADALLAASLPVAGERLRVLAPADMVLHSAYHLFNDEVGKPLRDLFDLHDLFSHFAVRAGFWEELIARARLHGLGRPLYYALRHTRRTLGTAIPAGVELQAARDAPVAPLNTLMDGIFDARFTPEPLDSHRPGAALARGACYLRAHWLRMPPLQLARHLAIKSLARARAPRHVTGAGEPDV